MNLLAITLCVLMKVIIAERLPSRFNTNQAVATSGRYQPPEPQVPQSGHLQVEDFMPHFEPPTPSINKFLYKYSFNIDTSIQADEHGVLQNVGTKQEALKVRGSYNYTNNEGNIFQVSYVADENGFQPQGAHLLDIPPLIKKALQYIAEHPEENEK